MNTLHIDIETYCDLDLKKVGVHRYVEHPSFEILLMAYKMNGSYTCIMDIHNGVDSDFQKFLQGYIFRPSFTKIAHNASFEIACFTALFGDKIKASEWRCTMTGAAYLGLPLGLGEVARVLNLPYQKDAKGTALISYFSKPCKPTKANGGRTRNMPEDDPERWKSFKDYCKADVDAEAALDDYLSRYPSPPTGERTNWLLNEEINARGIVIDELLAREAIRANARAVEVATSELKELTGLDNPNSVTQMGDWLRGQGARLPSLDKETVGDALAGDKLTPAARRALELRGKTSNTSVKKYDAMLDRMQEDGRARGLLQFYGANRTGRFAGRGLQIQNLKRTFKDEETLLAARGATRLGVVDLLFDDVQETLSRVTRSALVAAPGHSLVVSDFSAIEARVLAWIAGEAWALDVFRTHGKVYEATAAAMFGVPIESVTRGSDLRAKGKVAVLALGYEGGAGALKAMGALREGLKEEELPGLVRAWRLANRNITRLWADVERAAKHATINKGVQALRGEYCTLQFDGSRGDYLFITLPSGRLLSYPGMEVHAGRLRYAGNRQGSVAWTTVDTYGGSLVENITQAVARDLLCHALRVLHAAGFNILTHVHDEIVCEERDGDAPRALDEMNRLLTNGPGWAKGLPLSAAGYVSKYYKKD
jgi:DNA polymerase